MAQDVKSSIVRICGYLMCIATLCTTQCPLQSPHVGTPSDGHYRWLTGINESINVTCERTCGNYTESWLLLFFNATANEISSLELNDAKVSLFSHTHGEISARLHHAPESNCSRPMVEFSLELAFINDSIHTIEGNIIVSCSAATGSNTKVHTPLSTVVYLPTRSTTTADPTTTADSTTTATMDPTTSSATRAPDHTTADLPCPGIGTGRSSIITIWADSVTFAGILLMGVLIGG